MKRRKPLRPGKPPRRGGIRAGLPPQPRNGPSTASRGTEVPTSARLAVSMRSGGRCEVMAPGCTGQADHVHHRQPRRMGDHRPANLIHVCHHCHAWVHAHPALSYQLGLMIHTWDTVTKPYVWHPNRMEDL